LFLSVILAQLIYQTINFSCHVKKMVPRGVAPFIHCETAPSGIEMMFSLFGLDEIGTQGECLAFSTGGGVTRSGGGKEDAAILSLA
jgi:hypothetical protein